MSFFFANGKEVFQIVVPGEPPSVNKYLKKTRNGHHYRSKEADNFYYAVKIFNKHKVIDSKARWAVRIEFHSSWYTLDGKFRVKDVDNYAKVAIDALKNATGIPDENFFEIALQKVHSEEKKVVYTLYQC